MAKDKAGTYRIDVYVDGKDPVEGYRNLQCGIKSFEGREALNTEVGALTALLVDFGSGDEFDPSKAGKLPVGAAQETNIVLVLTGPDGFYREISSRGPHGHDVWRWTAEYVRNVLVKTRGYKAKN